MFNNFKYNFDDEALNEKLAIRFGIIVRLIIVAVVAILLLGCKSSSPPTTTTYTPPTPTEVTFELPFVDLETGVKRTQTVTVVIDSIITQPNVTVTPKKIVDRSKTKVVMRNVNNNDTRTKIKDSDVGTLNQVDITSADSSSVTALPNQTTTQTNQDAEKKSKSFFSNITNLIYSVIFLVVVLAVFSLIRRR